MGGGTLESGGFCSMCASLGVSIGEGNPTEGATATVGVSVTATPVGGVATVDGASAFGDVTTEAETVAVSRGEAAVGGDVFLRALLLERDFEELMKQLEKG